MYVAQNHVPDCAHAYVSIIKLINWPNWLQSDRNIFGIQTVCLWWIRCLNITQYLSIFCSHDSNYSVNMVIFFIKKLSNCFVLCHLTLVWSQANYIGKYLEALLGISCIKCICINKYVDLWIGKKLIENRSAVLPHI